MFISQNTNKYVKISNDLNDISKGIIFHSSVNVISIAQQFYEEEVFSMNVITKTTKINAF